MCNIMNIMKIYDFCNNRDLFDSEGVFNRISIRSRDIIVGYNLICKRIFKTILLSKNHQNRDEFTIFQCFYERCSPLWMFCMCLLSLSLVERAFPHSPHLNFLASLSSAVCLHRRSCSFMEDILALIPQ